MDAARYFEMMHRAMSARKCDTTLLLRVKVQDLGGADAYLELRQEPGSARVRLFYSTMGRRNLNFQLFRNTRAGSMSALKQRSSAPRASASLTPR